MFRAFLFVREKENPGLATGVLALGEVNIGARASPPSRKLFVPRFQSLTLSRRL